MKRRLNLYHSSLHPVKETLTSQRVVWAVAAVLLVAAMARGGLEYALHSLQEQQDALTQSQQNLNERMMDLVAQANRQQPMRSLLRQTAQTELEISSRQALLAEFENRGTIQRDNLSPVLQELASIHTQGVWLTRISITPEGVELEGSTLEAGLIPRWMAKFSQTTTLAKHQFSVVDLQRDTSRVLNFALLSKPRTNDQEALIEEQMEGIKLNEILVPEI
ncbi:hypothetical protein CWE15_05295 [Aliidiomarina taiwanensis]|uniref:MSHA biogenesis protein MshI n=1 Tax=Aliidiomarina taiwanensis TaxID=946228 RepID=A0A432X7H5_9GAMM|nr:PilN domain-containing protein [Aliidiomarina taiwanensis]RUO42819.1 hypothetical protein CWE15_05295 [Aliidiomarina taiwanensis]